MEEAAIATEIASCECTRKGLNPEDLAAMEREMLVVLDWRTNAPTMYEFAQWYTLLHPLTVAGGDFNGKKTHRHCPVSNGEGRCQSNNHDAVYGIRNCIRSHAESTGSAR